MKTTIGDSVVPHIKLARRVMPNIICNDIKGVSPMVGPIMSIHEMKKYLESESKDEA